MNNESVRAIVDILVDDCSVMSAQVEVCSELADESAVGDAGAVVVTALDVNRQVIQRQNKYLAKLASLLANGDSLSDQQFDQLVEDWRADLGPRGGALGQDDIDSLFDGTAG